ncbi:hypothetical protein GYMLUDRAFT_89288 [Collybiopsis luxurians FD-317 M1]|uniref:Conserved oligomeric Golgi complex subunit 8 n=1 Tax=Collybiopsis luxurians FD-317 M1 TaxID=944289 RepID=A0A0D0B8C7_9AGAR|nr:hypothetical protein GYMLUDRAFT_89288 [Collybiopsis luxurians FD-317 M1]
MSETLNELLKTQSHHLTSSLTSLTHTSYPTFVLLYTSTSAFSSSLSEFSSSLDSLLDDSLPALESSVSNWNAETASVLATRRKTLTMLESYDKLRDLLDIPLLINTCIQNSYFSEALSLAAYARGLISHYSSPPLILTSVLAEVDVAINYMLVSLLMTLHEPNKKLPALWKAVNFLRKMEGAFRGEEEIVLSFLSGRELCLKGSLESLRRDIFCITDAEGKLLSRDQEDLAKYLGKYVGLWREGVYDLITQYESIFLTHPLQDASPMKLHALLTTYISHVFRTQLSPLLVSIHSSQPPITSLPMSALPSLITQLTYCTAALARIGAEFRSTLARCVNDAVIYIFNRDISIVENHFISNFEWNMPSKISRDTVNSPTVERKANPRSPSAWLLTKEALESNHLPSSSSTVPSHNPPSLLTSYLPLAIHANEVIEVLNSLWACAPISAARGYTSFDESQSSDDGIGLLKLLDQSLAREGQIIFEYVKAVINGEQTASASTELSCDFAVAIAFSRAFFETWGPWVIMAIAQGIFGLLEKTEVDSTEASDLMNSLNFRRTGKVGSRMFSNRGADNRLNFIFYQDKGGLRATDEENTDLATIYYLGIINILTPWGTGKRIENFWKGLSADRHKISPVPPVKYAEQFFKFMKAIMRGSEGDPQEFV